MRLSIWELGLLAQILRLRQHWYHKKFSAWWANGVGIQHAFLYDVLSRSQTMFKVNDFISADCQNQVFAWLIISWKVHQNHQWKSMYGKARVPTCNIFTNCLKAKMLLPHKRLWAAHECFSKIKVKRSLTWLV